MDVGKWQDYGSETRSDGIARSCWCFRITMRYFLILASLQRIRLNLNARNKVVFYPPAPRVVVLV